MQDIHSIGGGRFFTGSSGGGGGGGGGGDRRIRPHQLLHHQQAHQPPPVMKCPRCDSANTKFCYYNNYNLSQPRHFCKSCRRYWTKGGVLRNVPVGGGCRKTKRSKQKTASTAAPSTTTTTTTTTTPNNSHSSSESSSLTATTTAAEEASAPKLPEAAPVIDSGGGGGGVFSEIGNLTNLVAFEFGSVSHQNLMSQSWKGDEMNKVQEMVDDDQTAQVDLLGERSNGGGGGFGALGDWQQCGDDQGLFDLTNNVDHQQYWSQNQWNDQDNPNLYLP